MKRSEAVGLIWKRLGPLGICEDTCKEVLDILEEAGMYPPEADTMNNSEHLVLYVDNIDIPHWIRLGWDDEL
jgi:hypothetical protein